MSLASVKTSEDYRVLSKNQTRLTPAELVHESDEFSSPTVAAPL